MQILGVETFEANGERRMKVALHRGVTNTSHVPNDVLSLLGRCDLELGK